ncbi:MAG: N-acetylmuramoyl-L-alanine amidase, partial [Verrucomicrobiota bacterium]
MNNMTYPHSPREMMAGWLYPPRYIASSACTYVGTRMKSALLLALALGASANAGQHIVVIDPGHGGGDDSGSQSARSLSASNNATAPGGLHEKDLTLELSLEIRKQLEALAPAHRDTRIDCV